MRTRILLFVTLLIAGGAGVWAGMTYAGTANGIWVERVLGALMLLFGGMMLFSQDAFDRGNTRLTGAGFSLMGLSWMMPSGSWRIATSVVALGLMIVPVIRRRRAAAVRPSS